VPDTHQRVGDLEIDQDLDFTRKEVTFQRVGWVVLGLVLIAAVLGLFGKGIFSTTEVGDRAGPLCVEYERALRFDALHRLSIQIGPAAVSDGKTRLWINEDYLSGVQIKHIHPPPDAVELNAGGKTFVFGAPDVSRPLAVIFHIVPERMGRLSGRVQAAGREHTFTQFVFP
jgi:hypothetical protein